MTAKELKKLTRSELIELLIDVEKENINLREENQQLNEALEKRELYISSSGTMAEASMKLAGVFEAADAAAAQYLENTKAECERMKADAKNKVDAFYAEANARMKVYLDEHPELKPAMIRKKRP